MTDRRAGSRSVAGVVDEHLRRRLDASSGAVDRVVRSALERRPSGSRRGALRAVWTTAAVVVVLVAGLLVWPSPADRGEEVRSPAQLSMTNVGDLIVVRDGRGGSLLGGLAPSRVGGQSGQIIIQRGERR